MRDDQHRAALLCQIQQHIQHLTHHLGIERSGHLVKEHQRRVHDECPNDGDPLLLPAGKLPGIVLRPVGEPHALEQSQGFRLRVFSSALLHHARGKRDVIQNALVRKQLVALKNHPDLLPELRELPGVCVDLFTVQKNTASLDELKGVDASQKRALSAAAGADDDRDLALLECEAQVVQHCFALKFLVQMLDTQYFASHAFSSTSFPKPLPAD